MNEASWLAIDVDTATACAEATLEVLALPLVGPAPGDATVVLVLGAVSRVTASLRNGRWDDTEAPVRQLSLADLHTAVRSFGGSPVFGWEFIDPPTQSWAGWCDRLSLDITLSPSPGRHVLELFQEGEDSTGAHHLDFRICFSSLRIAGRGGVEVPVQEFIDGGVRGGTAYTLTIHAPAEQGSCPADRTKNPYWLGGSTVCATSRRGGRPPAGMSTRRKRESASRQRQRSSPPSAAGKV